MLVAEVYRGKGRSTNCWRWRIKAGNGRIVAVSGEAFHSRYNAGRALRVIIVRIRSDSILTVKD